MSSDKTAKHLQRIALALRIERNALSEEMSPCDSCIRSHRRCVALPAGKRCSECARSGRAGCNFKQKLPTLGDWASIDRQRKKLRDEQNEAMAKVLRLRKMEELLDEREKKMIELGLSTLGELDAREAADLAEAARLEAAAANLVEASSFLNEFTLDPEALNNLPDSFWAGLSSPPLSLSQAALEPSSGLASGADGTSGVSQSNG